MECKSVGVKHALCACRVLASAHLKNTKKNRLFCRLIDVLCVNEINDDHFPVNFLTNTCRCMKK